MTAGLLMLNDKINNGSTLVPNPNNLTFLPTDLLPLLAAFFVLPSLRPPAKDFYQVQLTYIMSVIHMLRGCLSKSEKAYKCNYFSFHMSISITNHMILNQGVGAPLKPNSTHMWLTRS